MTYGLQHDIGAYLLAELAQATVDITAGGSGDNAEQNGQAINRLATGRRHYESAALVIAYRATLAQAATLSVAANGQHAPVSNFASGAVDLMAKRAYQIAGDGTKTAMTLTSGLLAATVVATGGAGGSTESGVVVLEFDLASVQQYLRSQITFDLSAATTDTARMTAVWVFGGADALPTA
ncbi:MAG TPA: hypothetical protein VNP04_15540 [Alphaproteobacteria bacterium]|nr:hypothetical protein [Alphaproteobacteria bacterium]